MKSNDQDNEIKWEIADHCGNIYFFKIQSTTPMKLSAYTQCLNNEIQKKNSNGSSVNLSYSNAEKTAAIAIAHYNDEKKTHLNENDLEYLIIQFDHDIDEQRDAKNVSFVAEGETFSYNGVHGYDVCKTELKKI